MTTKTKFEPTRKTLNVFAVQGADPEVQAYGMAKYSRSSLSLKEAIGEISQQKAEDFLNTFYFQYGHKSIADLAHVPVAVENLSLLAAIEVVDEQLWDGQERSTRYQDFSKREYYTPTDLDETQSVHFHSTMHMLFDAYDEVLLEARTYFSERNPRPEGMDEGAYWRTVNARAFDVARYLLPMATLTSLGQITSARTLEGQVSRLLASPYKEVQQVGESLKAAVTIAAPYNVASAKINKALVLSQTLPPSIGLTQLQDALHALVPNVAAVPTLVKYAEPRKFQTESREVARELLKDLRIYDPDPRGEDSVSCVVEGNVEIDILSALLYEVSHYSYDGIRMAIHSQGYSWVAAAITKLLAVRGPHDELLRGYHARAGMNFDIVMDLGGYRDLHRHRRAIHISQGYSTCNGFAPPQPFCTPRLEEIYEEATRKVQRAFEVMRGLRIMNGESTEVASYLLPLGTRHRFTMKMDVAEAAYIAELRTGPAGHISYRNVAWKIYRILRDVAPTLASAISYRVTDPSTPLDFFKR